MLLDNEAFRSSESIKAPSGLRILNVRTNLDRPVVEDVESELITPRQNREEILNGRIARHSSLVDRKNIENRLPIAVEDLRLNKKWSVEQLIQPRPSQV